MSMERTVVVLTAVVLLAVSPAVAQWPQWGGPNRDFTIKARGLADQWPEDGPKKLWHRELGDGYSTIVVDDGVLYTMYRVEEDEFTVALKVDTGQTIWEHKNPSPFTPQMAQFGPGPHATPLIVGDWVYSVGSNAVLHCFDKRSGSVAWKCDLLEKFGGELPGYGYSCSPIVYKQTIILPVTSKPEQEQPLVAFDQASGRISWRGQPADKATPGQFEYATPLIIEFEGQDQMVFFGGERVSGFDPSTGEFLWSSPHAQPNGVNASTPVWDGRDTLFCSAAYGSGAQAIRLKREGDRTVPEQLWHSRKMRIHHGNAILIGDHVYASSGDFGPAFFMAMNIHTGKPAWRKRGFSKATCVYADGKLILLDEDGQLALTTVSPEGLTVHSQCKIAERYAWAAPTLVGTTLYVRDRRHIMALDLGG